MLHTVDILRLETNPNYGTFGALRFDTEAFCVTLEPPNFANMRNISCIPAAQYMCGRVVSPKFGDTFEVRHVPNRSSILFHPGNRVKDTEGCIVTAQYFGKLRGDRAVLNSGATFKRFMDKLDGEDEFHLTIRECF